jgi:GNAT superfamily N-acetyltransferase
MEKIDIIEFEPKYVEDAKSLARLAMEEVGIEPDVIDLYIHDDFDYETIVEVYKNRSRLWLALMEDRVVGTIAIAEVNLTTARLRRMFVLPRAQRRGVGQKLFDTALRFSKEKGYRKIVLDTDRLMHSAQSFYERNGFHRVSSEKDRVFYELTI